MSALYLLMDEIREVLPWVLLTFILLELVGYLLTRKKGK